MSAKSSGLYRIFCVRCLPDLWVVLQVFLTRIQMCVFTWGFGSGLTYCFGVFLSLPKFLVCFWLFVMSVIKVFALFVFCPDVVLDSDTAVCVRCLLCLVEHMCVYSWTALSRAVSPHLRPPSPLWRKSWIEPTRDTTWSYDESRFSTASQVHN